MFKTKHKYKIGDIVRMHCATSTYKLGVIYDYQPGVHNRNANKYFIYDQFIEWNLVDETSIIELVDEQEFKSALKLTQINKISQLKSNSPTIADMLLLTFITDECDLNIIHQLNKYLKLAEDNNKEIAKYILDRIKNKHIGNHHETTKV